MRMYMTPTCRRDLFKQIQDREKWNKLILPHIVTTCPWNVTKLDLDLFKGTLENNEWLIWVAEAIVNVCMKEMEKELNEKEV